MLKRALAAGLALLVIGAGSAAILMRQRAVPAGAPAVAPSARAPRPMVPADVRIRVEVVNATRTRGLARRATMYLRDRGFDVVGISTSAETRDSTLVLDRSNHPEWARLAASALGGAPVEARPDTSRYLDVTILLGANWRPPAEPFYP